MNRTEKLPLSPLSSYSKLKRDCNLGVFSLLPNNLVHIQISYLRDERANIFLKNVTKWSFSHPNTSYHLFCKLKLAKSYHLVLEENLS